MSTWKDLLVLMVHRWASGFHFHHCDHCGNHCSMYILAQVECAASMPFLLLIHIEQHLRCCLLGGGWAVCQALSQMLW